MATDIVRVPIRNGNLLVWPQPFTRHAPAPADCLQRHLRFGLSLEPRVRLRPTLPCRPRRGRRREILTSGSARRCRTSALGLQAEGWHTSAGLEAPAGRRPSHRRLGSEGGLVGQVFAHGLRRSGQTIPLRYDQLRLVSRYERKLAGGGGEPGCTANGTNRLKASRADDFVRGCHSGCWSAAHLRAHSWTCGSSGDGLHRTGSPVKRSKRHRWRPRREGGVGGLTWW